MLITSSVLLPKHRSCVKLSYHILYQKKKKKKSESSFLLPALHKDALTTLHFDIISILPPWTYAQMASEEEEIAYRHWFLICIINMSARFPLLPFFLVVFR